MPYVVQNGLPVRVEVHVDLTPEEVPDPTPVAFLCPECGKTYKTETGRDNHLATKH